jgi:hypothetical protein
MSFHIAAADWSAQQFSDCQLGDKRRTRRLIQVAEQVANDPAASFPNQMASWGDLKATYRLFDCDDVTFESITQPHYQQTRNVSPGRYLVLSDTTEIDFGRDRQIEGLSKIGNGSGRGFLLHNALMVAAEEQTLIGVAGQTIHYRKPKPKNENASQRMKRERESRVWGDVIRQVGAPKPDVQLVYVCDRGADQYEVFHHLREHRCDWVIRGGLPHRKVLDSQGQTYSLQEYLPNLTMVGSYELDLRTRPGQKARTAKLEVHIGTVDLPAPRHQSPAIKSQNPSPIGQSIIWLREVDTPRGVTPIEWILYSSLPVTSFDEAWQIIEYYECRWLVEEYHKALKTGCHTERRILHNPDRLEAMVGLMSVVAVRLLQLKSIAKVDPDRPARTVVPSLWLKMLKAARQGRKNMDDLTIEQFYRELAKLGGFLGRRHDGNPGWITIWRGWDKLNQLVQGAKYFMKHNKCG